MTDKNPTTTTARQLAESIAIDASTAKFQPSLLDVMDWVYSQDLRFAGFLPLKDQDPRLEQLRQMLLPSKDRS
jgi:hypothetical protein